MNYSLHCKRACLCLTFLLFSFSGLTSAPALELTLDPPGDREFVRDLAGMLDENTTKQIKEICDKLLTDKATPIIVVTIDSMAKHGGADMRIETFATILFNQWQIGHAKLGDQDWNTGILLLVSKDDRKARIELGAGWGHREDQLCRQIMDDYIIANFKQGQFPAGILAGVEALDKMARKLELPAKPVSPWSYVIIAVFIGLAIFTVVSLIRRGSSGWAWLFWGVVFAVIGTILYQMLNNSGSDSGGGFSGGSFGGGFSGGGGASGSW
ncbi:MAG: TPM domain-containing protein [Planctomycetaceae bacterium]|nr:TPM domain-containing protein [Planctomycetaceae bacterium]